MTPPPSPPQDFRAVEVMLPATDNYLTVLRATCTSFTSDLGFGGTTVEVLRNALDSAATRVLHEWPEGDELHAVFRVRDGVLEIDVFPRSGERATPAAQSPTLTADAESPHAKSPNAPSAGAEAAPRMCCMERPEAVPEPEPAAVLPVQVSVETLGARHAAADPSSLDMIIPQLPIPELTEPGSTFPGAAEHVRPPRHRAEVEDDALRRPAPQVLIESLDPIGLRVSRRLRSQQDPPRH